MSFTGTGKIRLDLNPSDEKKTIKKKITWFALQELLEVENGLFVVLFPEHDVSHHLRTDA